MCSEITRHDQTQCTLQLSVQWVHQTWSNSLHTSVKCAVSLITWNFVSRCGSTFDAIHGQTHCTLQLSVPWVHQTWSNSLHTSVKFAVTLLTWNFVSRCGQMFLEYRSACVYGNIRLWCKELVWEEMRFKWNDQLYMLHAKVGSCWKDPTGHVHMEVMQASKQREDRNLLQVELARIQQTRNLFYPIAVVAQVRPSRTLPWTTWPMFCEVHAINQLYKTWKTHSSCCKVLNCKSSWACRT